MGNNNTLGSRIKISRQRMGLSQSELAAMLNCTQAALSQYECSNREPGLNDLSNIAKKLNTTTDYLLGLTDVSSTDTNIKMIGDYLGLTEESIEKLHCMYIQYKEQTSEDKIFDDLKIYTGVKPADEAFELDYNFVKQNSILDLENYTRILNDFICSPEFSIFVSRLMNNLFLERTVYDILRIATKQYESIVSPRHSSNIAEIAYGLVEESEDDIKHYSLNLFDIQNAIMDFCRNYTKLEIIKKLDYDESLYRKIQFYIYHYTRPMFEVDIYSTEALEEGLSESLTTMLPSAVELLKGL